ncbi:MAG: hypothetical protein U0X91_22025 [Spirosomataceae bacterium]
MKTLQNPAHFAFTNHFNQSLLKSRIAMMNRRRASWEAMLKYGAFIAVLWLVAAFTKPYQVKVAAKITNRLPALKPLLLPQLKVIQPVTELVAETELTVPRKDSAQTLPLSFNATDTLISQTKYVIYKNNKLHWVITPMMGYDEFIAILNEFEKVGANFFVKQFRYDPLQQYLSGITLKTSYLEEGQDCYTEVSGERQTPITAFGGWVSIDGRFCSIDTHSFDPQFKPIVEEVDDKVRKWINAHANEYRNIALNEEVARKERQWKKYESEWDNTVNKYYRNPLKTPNGLARFRTDALQYLCETGAHNRIYFEDRALRFENFYKDAEFFIDTKPSGIGQAEQLLIDDIAYVFSASVYTDSTRKSAKRTFLIFTKNQPAKP